MAFSYGSWAQPQGYNADLGQLGAGIGNIIKEKQAQAALGDYVKSLYMQGQGQQQAQAGAAQQGTPAVSALQEFGLPDQQTLQSMLQNPETREQGMGLIQQARSAYEEANDPLKKLQLQKAQYEVQHMGDAATPQLTSDQRNFQYAQQNPGFAEFIGKSGAEKAPAAVQEYLWYRQNESDAGRQPMSYVDFKNSGKSGFSVTTNPDGTVSVTQGGTSGGGMPKLTEQQSKDIVYYTRGVGALPTLDETGAALADPVQRAMGADPTGLIRGRQSDEFQQADQAGREFLASILRKDTGAAVTDSEMSNYGKTYLPQPGDNEAVLAQKQTARARALEALKLGIPTQAIVLIEAQGIGAPKTETSGVPAAGTVMDGYRFKGGDPSDQNNWEPAQ